MKKLNTGHALIFDSGVGGLSVVTEIAKLNTNLKLTYIADDNFRPYGEKTELQLKSRLPRLLWELTETFKPDLVVIACNTASKVIALANSLSLLYCSQRCCIPLSFCILAKIFSVSRKVLREFLCSEVA